MIPAERTIPHRKLTVRLAGLSVVLTLALFNITQTSVIAATCDCEEEYEWLFDMSPLETWITMKVTIHPAYGRWSSWQMYLDPAGHSQFTASDVSGNALGLDVQTNATLTRVKAIFGALKGDGWSFQIKWLSTRLPRKSGTDIVADWAWRSSAHIPHLAHLWLPSGYRLLTLEANSATRSTETRDGREYVTFFGISAKDQSYYWRMTARPPAPPVPSTAQLSVGIWFPFRYRPVKIPVPNISEIVIDGLAMVVKNDSIRVSLKTRESHSVGVPNLLYQGEDVRVVFDSWSDGVKFNPRNLTLTKDAGLTAIYAVQYKLSVISDYGNTQGSGWYDENTYASISVTPKTEFLVSHVFDHWDGLEGAHYPAAEVLVDEPKIVKAVWRSDYSQLIAYSTILEAVAIVSIIMILRARRRHRSELSDKTKVY